MDALSSPPLLSLCFSSSLCNTQTRLNPSVKVCYTNPTLTNTRMHGTKYNQLKVKAVLNDVSAAAADPVQAQVTWEIIVGSLAGVIPFIVAGIEFSKRIAAQRSCAVCGGSGLVLRDKKYYFRCPRCGGFLPWQSWKRFFSG